MILLIVFDSGRQWIRQMVVGALLLPSLVSGTAFFINFIAMYYHASRAIPFGTMVRKNRKFIQLCNCHRCRL